MARPLTRGRQAAALAATRLRRQPRRPPHAAPQGPGGAAGPPPSLPPLPLAVQRVLDRGEDEEIVGWQWTGSDEFTPLNDRADAPPLPLPRLTHSRRVVLVRHGQSTWNARNRIQGSSNFSTLTEKGLEQAHAARALLAGWDFDCMFYSPLARAAHTGAVVWGGRAAPALQLACLREIDLYSFQGLDKIENRTLYPGQYAAWQAAPADFTIDGHAPVRELWYRASLAWGEVLGDGAAAVRPAGPGCSLVVAHNAVNQALLCTALGLPPAFFRRFSQSNAAFTVLDFEYGGAEGSQRRPAPPRVRVERMNQFPDSPLTPSKLGKSLPNRLVLIGGAATSPKVQAALGVLRSVGVTTAPLICVGSPEQQALDILTAVQAALSTPGGSRTVVAVAAPEACQRVLGECIGGVSGGGAAGGAPQRSAAEVGALFDISDGGMTIGSWPQGQGELARCTIQCTNYQLPEGGGSSPP